MKCRFVIVALTLPGLLGGCSDEDGPTAILPGEVQARRVISGTGIAVLPLFAPGDDERLFVVDQEGLVRIVRDGQVLDEPFLDLTGVVSPVSNQGRGLLSMVFHPEFQDNGEFFVSYTVQDPGNDRPISRIDRLRVSPDPDRADPASRTPVFELPQSLGDHNGGHIFFGSDGMLFVAFGDGGSGAARGEAQNRENHLGSILRIDVTAVSPYRVPDDNPFVGDAIVPPEVLIWGVRNPWRLSFDAATGDLWIADVGEERWEEVTVIRASDLLRDDLNLGWPVMEGRECFEEDPCTPADFVLPSLVYSHDEGCSVTGGFVYRGTELPDLVGGYLFADFCEGWVRAVSASEPDGPVHDLQVDLEGEHPISFGTGNTGEIYISTFEGSVFRLGR